MSTSYNIWYVWGNVYNFEKNLNTFIWRSSSAVESTREDSSSLVAELQEKLQEEKARFLEQLEEQEKKKNEEMQNVRTSLIAEQQVGSAPISLF